MEGYEVVLIEDAIKDADLVVTATGNKDVVTADHMRMMKDELSYVILAISIMRFKSKLLKIINGMKLNPRFMKSNYQAKKE